MKRVVVSIVLIVAMILSIQSYKVVFAEGIRDEVKINMTVEVGFDGYYKLGNYAPFYFEIENKLKDINGELQIELPDEMDNLTVYSMQINLPQNSTKKFVMNVPMSRFLSKLQVNIVEGKNKVFTKSIKLSPGANIETFGLGILSDDYESVKYINKIPTGNMAQFSTKTVKLTANMISDNIDILKNFNVIVINNFDTSNLTQEQYAALKAWVVDGGTLLLGTGPSYSKTLAIFKDDFITGEIGDVSNVSTNQLYSVAQGKVTGEAMQLSTLNMSFKDSDILVAEGNTVLVAKMPKGSGSVAVAAFDLGLEPLSSWVGRASFSEKLLQKLMPDLYSNPYNSKDIYMNNNMYAIDNSLRNIPELPKTNTKNLLILLIAYIIAVAPLSYLILKKLDKREWMWLTVPVTSLIFAFVIYMTGFGTRMNEPIVNIINIVEFGSNGNATPKSYAGVFTPNKSNIRVEAAGGMNIKPITLNGYDQRGMGVNTDDKKEKLVVTKVTVAPKTVVEFYRTSVWSMKTLALSDNENLSGKFDVKINHRASKYQGTVTNNSGFDLQECYIATSNEVIDIGPIKNGETIEVKDKPGKYYAYPYEMINAIYKDPYQGRKPGQKLTTQEIDEFRKNMQKRQIMEYYLMGGGQGIKGAKLIGWSNNPIVKDILVNGKTTEKYEKNFIISNASITFKIGNKVSYPMGYIQPVITKNSLTNGNYDEYGKMFYGRGDVEISFQIDKEIHLDYAKIQYTVNQGGQSQVKQYIWNCQNNTWEEGNYGAFNIDKEKLSKYVDKDNNLKLKFEMYDGNVQLPQISVEGSVK
ncbi:MAG: hypothetical protein K0Q65_2558 [Clostridia bacterium]|nr:hypothetical protein [Clostridia bacterium]